MNAVVALCHFCENHGPRVVICTRPELRESNLINSGAESSVETSNCCAACAPVGCSLLVTAERGGRLYCTRQPPQNDETTRLLQQACVRSLSCEVSATQENSFVFFGDSAREHVLSYAFQIKDTQARGLKRWFSFILLMKDKMFLLNLTPCLIKQMEEIAEELQSLGNIVYTNDQAICSQRALRLKNNNPFNEVPRSLIDLTGKKHIFSFIHTKFICMLITCSRYFSEIACGGILPITDNNSTLNNSNDAKGTKSLYEVKKYLGDNSFLNAIFCILTGIQVIIRGDSDMCENLVHALIFFLPKIPKCLEYTDYIPPSEARIYFCKSNVAVPKPCSGILRIDIVDEEPIIHWTGSLPVKWPSMMVNIMKVFNEGIDEQIIIHHVNALKEEWMNNATVFKHLLNAPNSGENVLLTKKTIGIKHEDEGLLNYWMTNLA